MPVEDAGVDLTGTHKLREMLLRAMNILEAPVLPHVCVSPGCANDARYRCRDCDMEGLACHNCLLSAHLHLPFHNPEKWMDTHFSRITLRELGLVLYLGHGGEACPHTTTRSGIQPMTIVDTTGIHEVAVGWCRCANHPAFADQLLSRRFIPATVTRPKTAFTFRVLKLFQMLNHVAKTTPWDFTGTITRLTDNLNPRGVPVSPQILEFDHC